MKLKPLCAALALAAAGLSSAQAAAVVLSITPSQQNVAIGEIFTVDIVISGLTGINEIVSGFSLQVAFDDGFLSYFNGDLAPGVTALGGVGSVDFGFASAAANQRGGDATSFLTDGDLDALQGDSFTLMTLAFQGLADSVSFLNFGANFDSDRLVTGRLQNRIAGVLDLDYSGACIAVGNASCRSQVPEPASYGLAGLALLGCGLATTRRRQSVSAAA